VAFSYDPGGLLANQTSARGIVTTYTYDANHNLLGKFYSDGTPGITNAYDSFDRLIAVYDAVGTNVFNYDVDSRLTGFAGPWPNDAITYQYDPMSRLTNMTVQGSQPVGYVFDPLSRLVAVRVGASAYTYSYIGSNPLEQRLDRPNSSFTTYSYDSLS